jgi:hypothetical protein
MTDDEINARLTLSEIAAAEGEGTTDRAAYLALDADADAADPMTRIRIARGLIGITQWAEAHRILLAVEARWPDLADAQYWLGFVLLHGVGRTGAIAASARHLETATRLRPEWPEPWYKLGVSFLWQGHSADAERPLRQALALRPNWGKAHANLAVSLVEQERYAEGLKHYRLGCDPNSFEPALDRRDEIAQLERLVHQQKRKPSVVRYPTAPADFATFRHAAAEHLLRGVPKSPIIGLHTRVFALGSCFATNLSRSLTRYGVPVTEQFFSEDLNTTFANEAFFRWVAGGAVDRVTADVEKIFPEQQAKFREIMANTDVFIYTLGVAPGFFARSDGHYVFPVGGIMGLRSLFDQAAPRMTSVEENLANLETIRRIILELSPTASIFLTVSPIPLSAAFEAQSAIIEDCISKSTMRLAAHHMMQRGYSKFYYWPSFEIVRWLSGHIGAVFGAEDGYCRHLPDTLIDQIIDLFVAHYGNGLPTAAA